MTCILGIRPSVVFLVPIAQNISFETSKYLDVLNGSVLISYTESSPWSVLIYHTNHSSVGVSIPDPSNPGSPCRNSTSEINKK